MEPLKTKNGLISSLVLALGIAIAGFFVGRGIIEFKKFEQVVEVRGLDERLVKSNEASWQFNFSVTGNEMKELNQKVAAAQGAVQEFALAQGFTNGEIQKGGVSIVDQLANNYSNGKFQGPRYTARASVAISTKKIDQVIQSAEKTDQLIEKGVVLENSQVKYFFTDLNSIKPAMLKSATANARDAAMSFAENSGARLGRIKSASQGVFTIESPVADYDAGSSVMKKVRVVIKVEYFL